MHHHRLKESSVTVYDGDSFRADIDLGFGVWMTNQRFRLYGVNAPELRLTTLEVARVAKSALLTAIQQVPDEFVYLRTYRDAQEKYGRWLAELFDDVSKFEFTNSINQRLQSDPALGYTVLVY